MLSAIVVVGPKIQKHQAEAGTGPSHQGTPLACVEVLGQSVVGRLIEDLQSAGCKRISVFADATIAPLATSRNLTLRTTEDPWSAAQEQAVLLENDAEAVMVVRASAYVEFDAMDMLQSHREQRKATTRAFDGDGPLDIWIVGKSGCADLLRALQSSDAAGYEVRGRINRLEHPRDLRRLVVDGLTSRSHLRPRGSEIRPGVWVDDGAQLNRDARIVAPAYIGRGSRVEAQCLITRCSNIESNCQIDYGTVVEDSSILTNSYVGIGLDIAHSIVEGNNLLNLERSVTLEIADPCVIRTNRITRKEKNRRSPILFAWEGAKLSVAGERPR